MAKPPGADAPRLRFPFSWRDGIAKTAYSKSPQNGASGESFYLENAVFRGFRAGVRVSPPSRLF